MGIEGLVYRRSVTLSAPKEVTAADPKLIPNFGVLPTYTYTFWLRATKFGVVTYGDVNVLWGQPRHCILHKFIARFVSDELQMPSIVAINE